MSQVIFDVDEADFAERVLARSAEVPVVVDFWAAWCGPCRTLGPILEAAVTDRGGEVELAKVDVDANQGLAMQYRVQGIPAVKVFRNGQVVQAFEGAVPRATVDQVLDAVVPTAGEKLVAAAEAAVADGREDEARTAYREALTLDPVDTDASVGLAELLRHDDPEEARRLATQALPDPRAEALLTSLELDAVDGDPDELRHRLDRDPHAVEARLDLARVLVATGDARDGVDLLLDGVALGEPSREACRNQLVQVFNLLGDDDPVVTDGRRRLANVLF